MKRVMTAVVCACVIGAAGVSAAQENQRDKGMKAVSVTGCVAGKDGHYRLNEPVIAGQKEAMSYELLGGDLKDHVGHTVVVAGSMDSAIGNDGRTPADTLGAIRVTSVTMRSTTCPGGAAMTGMEAAGGVSQAARRAAGMTEMMGAPGLVPFDIMTGQAGKWMVGYQFMSEKMAGNLVGADDIGESAILKSFFATPTDMTMQMHMGMVMYAPTDKLTVMALLPYIRKEMNHITVAGERFAERTDGIGDIELRGMYSIHQTTEPRQWFLLTGGVGLPTGSIDAKMGEMRLEYPMQIGSGTFSLLPGFAYLGQALPWGWAADFGATVRVGRNANDYSLGNRYQASASITRELTKSVSVSGGARGELWENIRGLDPLLDPMDEPTKDSNLQGGKRFSAVLGITCHPESGFLKGQHFHFQADVPVLQSLDGPQLQRTWAVRAGWQLEF